MMAVSGRAPRVLVVGAGIIGSACAAALAEAGLNVTVIHDPARNTADASGGHLLLQSKSFGRHLDLARRSLELLEAQILDHKEELRFTRSGSLILARDHFEVEALRSHFDSLAGAGLPLSWLTGEDARQLEPAISPKVRAASFCPLDAQIDPVALRDFWRKRSASAGAEYGEGVVEASEVVDGRCSVRLSCRSYEGDALVLAAGAWMGRLGELIPRPIVVPMRPRRGLLLHGRSQACLTNRPLLGASYLRTKFEPQRDLVASVAFSLQQLSDGRVILGGTREFAGFDPRVEDEQVRRVIEMGTRYVPALGEFLWERATVGFRPFPMIGPLICDTEIPGLFIACGHEGDGITLAAATAEIITEKISAYLNR